MAVLHIDSSDSTDRIGGYELIERIASGGMATVFRAKSAALGREVALKFMRAEYSSNYVALARFRTETEAVAELDHPNIVPIFDVGEQDGMPFFAMKLIHGSSLSSLAPDPITSHQDTTTARRTRYQHEHRIAEIVATIARAIDHAHQRGILHRDLKPANVLVDEDGTPYVTDFGLAKRTEHDEGLTLTEMVIGTPCFMAPEQAIGDHKSISLLSDVYSLGAILYFLITGQAPFRGNSPVDIIRQVADEEPRAPWNLVTEADRDLSLIALKAMNKQPQDRYASAADLALDLERWHQGEPILARPSTQWEKTQRWIRRKPYQAALVGVSMLFLALFLIQTWVSYRQIQAQQTETQMANDRLSRTIAEIRINKADELLGIGRVGEAVAQLTANIREPSTARQSLPFLMSVLEQNRFPRLTGSPIEQGTLPHGMRFHPNGRLLATGSFSDGRCHLWDIETGLAVRPPLVHQDRVYSIDFDEHGDRLLTGSFDGTARLWDTMTGEPISPPLRHDGPIHVTRYNRERNVIVTAGNDCVARIWTGDGSGLAYPELVHSKDEIIIHIAEHVPDQDLLITGSVLGHFWLWEVPSGRLITQLTEDPKYVRGITFQASGKRFASVEEYGISLFNSNTLESVGFLSHPASSLGASFDQSGRQILTSARDGLHLWNTESLTPVAGLPEIDMDASRLDLFPHRNSFLIIKLNRITGFDFETLEPSFPTIAGTGGIHSLRADANHDQIAVAYHEGRIEVWSPPPNTSEQNVVLTPTATKYDQAHFVTDQTGQQQFVLAHRDRNTVEVRSLDEADSVEPKTQIEVSHPIIRSGSGERFVGISTYGQTGIFTILDTWTGEKRVIDAPENFDKFGIGPDEQQFYMRVERTSSPGRGVRMFSVPENQFVGDIIEEKGSVERITCSDDGQIMAVGTTDGMIAFWNLADQTRIGSVKLGKLNIAALKFTPRGRTIVGVNYSGVVGAWTVTDTVKPVWRRELGAEVEPLGEGQLDISMDGQQVALSTQAANIHLWRMSDGSPLFPILPQSSEVKRLKFVPGHPLLLAVSSKGHFRFWNTETAGPASANLRWHGAWTTVNLSRDGKHYSVGIPDGRIALRTVPTPTSPASLPPWFAEFAEGMAGMSLDPNERIEVISWEERLARLKRLENLDASQPLVNWARDVSTALLDDGRQ